jgi:cytochrome bd-type quinol oxidase subunit 2
MYLLVLLAHSLVRWAVLACALWATLSALGGLRARRAWTRRARVPGIVLAAVADVPLLLGLSLWLSLSPHAVTQGARSHYWTFLHPLMGLLVVVLVHVGSVKVRRGLDDGTRWRTAARFYGTALVIAVLGVPWPIAGMGRPLLPF